jgi:RNA polymerase sigma-70 factor, ECF subfamily
VNGPAALPVPAPASRRGIPPHLLQRARAGDPTAVEALAERALRLSLRTAAAVLGGRGEAADVAQEVAIEVLRGLAGLRDPASFDAWVHRITVRSSMRQLRRRRARAGSELPLAEMPEGDVPGAGGDPADLVDELAAVAAVRGALGALPARQRVAVALRYGHDMTEREVARTLGCQPGTAAALLSRGRAALRISAQLAAFLDGEEAR